MKDFQNRSSYIFALVCVVMMCWCYLAEAGEKQAKTPSVAAKNKLERLRQYQKAQQQRRDKAQKYRKWRLQKIKLLRMKRKQYRISQAERARRIGNILKKYHEKRLRKTKR